MRAGRLRKVTTTILALYFTLVPTCIALGLGISEGRASFAAARGQGVRGTFTATDHHCSGTRGGPSCDWRGTFDSSDGTVHLTDISAGTDTRVSKVGDRAEFLLNYGRLYREHTNEWTQWAFWTALGAAGLIAHLVVAVRWAARRRRAHQQTTTPATTT